ncbi:aminoglycoside phosphotransferase family protein [Metasolibacillus meyeri]|uniref:aminoglycoside phosphotransferase family protein n=1 Tax=Metasolibacillus meyeri TaxID=1071052 RepID=UPI000D31B61C|nr:phosphotransferase [Metasolibacillus meyeri]
MQAIKDYNTFQKIEAINKGWSTDKKYYIETINNEKRLLRIANISEYNNKKAEFDTMKQVAALDVSMSQPLDFGICHDGQSVYSLFTWCNGNDAEDVLPQLTEIQQYELGIKSGEMLKLIHSIPAPLEQEDWATRFNRKTNHKIKTYKDCPIQFDGDEQIIHYIENNRHLLLNRPQSLHHGDYHVGNMIISPNNTLSIIDFNRFDFGDPWEEFNRIVWSAAASPHFATGQLNGYFDGKPPIEFFKLLAFYISSNTLSSMYWAIPFGEKEIVTMKNQAKDILSWFDNMNNPVPTWYLEKSRSEK